MLLDPYFSHIPLQYWGDCILTAIHLINHLLAPILKDKSPFEILTHKSPDYKQLKIFGCLCYAYTSPKGRHKFDPRAKACAFLGYHTGVTGYKLLDLESYNILISRHVIFHEELFPFAGSNLSQADLNFYPDLVPPSPVIPIAHGDEILLILLLKNICLMRILH